MPKSISNYETIILVKKTLLTPEETDELMHRLLSLRQQRRDIDAEITRICERVDIIDDNPRPTWGPCTRCGHIWKGRQAGSPPRACAQCGSTGWREAPRRNGGRTPDDPPNPKWKTNRKTGNPTDPANRAIPGVLPKWMRDRIEERRAEDLAAITHAKTSRNSSSSLKPPPRLADIAPSLVPEARVRFAESKFLRPPTFEEEENDTHRRISRGNDGAGSVSGTQSTSDGTESLSVDKTSEMQRARMPEHAPELAENEKGSLPEASGEPEVAESRAEVIEMVETDGRVTGGDDE